MSGLAAGQPGRERTQSRSPVYDTMQTLPRSLRGLEDVVAALVRRSTSPRGQRKGRSGDDNPPKGGRQAIYTVSSCPHVGPSPSGRHIEQRTYGISTGTGSLELSVILFSPEIFTSNSASDTATPSEHDAITRTFRPSSCNDLMVHF
jgi:hypothetical protein